MENGNQKIKKEVKMLKKGKKQNEVAQAINKLTEALYDLEEGR